MPVITLPAHYDGERICLDEEFEMEPNSKLIVTVLPKEEKRKCARRNFFLPQIILALSSWLLALSADKPQAKKGRRVEGEKGRR